MHVIVSKNLFRSSLTVTASRSLRGFLSLLLRLQSPVPGAADRRSGLASTVLLASLAAMLPMPTPLAAAANPHHPAAFLAMDERVDLEPLRELYLASVRDGDAIPRGMDEIRRLRARGSVAAGSPLDATLTAYEGALVTLKAKHAFWPAQKLRYLRQGLTILDRTVAAHPEHAEARYLRLMSCYYLPGILGRSGSVRDDFAALARLLPAVRPQYPRPLYEAIVRFVLEKGRVDPHARRALEASLKPGDA